MIIVITNATMIIIVIIMTIIIIIIIIIITIIIIIITFNIRRRVLYPGGKTDEMSPPDNLRTQACWLTRSAACPSGTSGARSTWRQRGEIGTTHPLSIRMDLCIYDISFENRSYIQ